MEMLFLAAAGNSENWEGRARADFFPSATLASAEPANLPWQGQEEDEVRCRPQLLLPGTVRCRP
jgi:hypothetical protein